jgi:hypothetical protein
MTHPSGHIQENHALGGTRAHWRRGTENITGRHSGTKHWEDTDTEITVRSTNHELSAAHFVTFIE